MVTAELNITIVPGQILFADAVIFMDGVTEGITIIAIGLLDALGVVTQPRLEVRIQVIISPLANVLSV